ncbi:unnamed protein product [Penicillium bialowiezense]
MHEFVLLFQRMRRSAEFIMSGLEAFSLACNVMTVITFALDTAKVCRTIKKSGSSDPELKQNTSHRKQIFNDVEQALKLSPSATQPTDAEKRLRKLATECMGYAEAIQAELDYTSGQNGGRFATARATIRTVRRKRHIDECTQQLEAAKSTLDSALLAEIFGELMQSRGSKISIYDKLNKQQQDLIDNNHQTRDLLFAFRASEEAQAYEKLLLSLKYDQMNSRKTSIPHQHESTFEWMFPGVKTESSPGGAHSGDKADGVITSSSVSTSNTTWQEIYEDARQHNVVNLSLVQWLQGDCRCLYWVNGKPGSGKSTFMKFIENDERTKKALQIWQPKYRIISHFLWKPGTEDQQSFKGMLCSLFYQTLCEERDIALRILRDTPSLVYRNVIADWDEQDLTRLLLEVFRCSSSAYLVLLDGLDELSKSDRGLSKLFPLLGSLTALDRIKLCISSRPERPFSDKFESVPSLRMQDLTQGDIVKYTVDFLKELQLEPHDELHGKICSQVSFRSNGVFIWVCVVLKSVKHGIEQYNETWDDIYDRITELPPDLMKLYKDMWSRLGEHNEKYVNQAARYFQYTRTAHLLDRNIAALAIIADDNTLDAFTSPNEIPRTEEWVKLSQNTSIILMPVSVGLLEIVELDGPFEPKQLASESENNLKLLPWRQKHVRFVHRSAQDFLDSAEGKELFEKYTLGPEQFLSLCIKAQLALRSVGRDESQPLYFIWSMILSGNYLNGKDPNSVPETPRGILSLIHRCAVNESRGLIWPPYSISHENFFLFEASNHGFYEYVTEILESRGDYNLNTLIYVLIGACQRHKWLKAYSPLDTTRYLFIKDLLQQQSRPNPECSTDSKIRDASEGIMLAWRCFLLHELSDARASVGIDAKRVEEILEMFIKCGVMLESPGPKYLITVDSDTRQIVKSASDKGTAVGYECPGSQPPHRLWSSIYIEVNDAFLLARLSERNCGTSELVSAEAKNASMRPILADNGTGDAEIATFFHITVPEDDQESFKNWVLFEKSEYLSQNFFPDQQPNFLQAVDLGEFENFTQALEKIGYDLPEVNKVYDCLHEWIVPFQDVKKA